jgi:hypothetical protein
MTTRAPHAQDVIATLHLINDDGLTSQMLTVELIYDPADPFAVSLGFLPGRYAIHWEIACDLLISGIEGGAGDGDVRIATFSLLNGDVTIVTLNPSEGTCADFTFITDDLIKFLLVAEELVPLGGESRIVQAELDSDEWTRPSPGTADHA